MNLFSMMAVNQINIIQSQTIQQNISIQIIMSHKFKPYSQNLYTLNQQSLPLQKNDNYLNNLLNSTTKNPIKTYNSHNTHSKNNHDHSNHKHDSLSDDEYLQTDNFNLDDIQLQQNNNREEIQKLNNSIEAFQGKITALKLINKQLKTNQEMSEVRSLKHEQKQRELIKKISHQHITIQQMQYEIKKCNEQIIKLRDSKQQSDERNAQSNLSYRKLHEQQVLFVNSFRKVADAISKCHKIEDFTVCTKKFIEYIHKNLTIYQKNLGGVQSSKSNNFGTTEQQLELNFQITELSSLQHKLHNLQNQNKTYAKHQKQLSIQLEKQRSDKKRIISDYDEKINNLKHSSKQIKIRIQEREQQFHDQISRLKGLIIQKNEHIKELKAKIQILKSHLKQNKHQTNLNLRQRDHYLQQQLSERQIQNSRHHKNQSQCSKKSNMNKNQKNKNRKRSFYIGDGEHSNTQYMFNQLENHIDKLERELIEELQQQ